MTDREKLELAAKAMGIKHVDYTGINYDGSIGLAKVNENGMYIGSWSPLTNQSGSADMRDALEIDVQYFSRSVRARSVERLHFHARVAHNGTPEDRSRAVREAVLLVAAEIGRVKT